MPSMSGLRSSSAPTVSPGPVTRLITPAGTPTSRRTLTNSWASSGASDDGFITTVLPAIRAPAAGPPESAIGKLKGLITAQTP
jgi:hypothetical protein